jgi:hypothetical protein
LAQITLPPSPAIDSPTAAPTPPPGALCSEYVDCHQCGNATQTAPHVCVWCAGDNNNSNSSSISGSIDDIDESGPRCQSVDDVCAALATCGAEPDLVNQTNDGSSDEGLPWWIWLIVGVGACCCLLLLVALVVFAMRRRGDDDGQGEYASAMDMPDMDNETYQSTGLVAGGGDPAAHCTRIVGVFFGFYFTFALIAQYFN